jgi:molecular chaperone HscB
VETDFFASLGIPRHLAIDVKDLEQRYYALSRKLHPDLFARRSQAERDGADATMAVLNDAWRTLRDPITRALYVLKQEGYDIAEQGTKEVPPELLEEVFDLNMALDEIEQGDSDAANQVMASRNRFEGMRNEIDADLVEQFAQWDGGGGAKSLQEIRSLLNRRKYVTNLINRATQATEHVSD